jgi:hypothetical protein
MLTGKHFRLMADTMAIEIRGDKRLAVMISAGEIIEIIFDPLPTDGRMVGIRCKGKAVGNVFSRCGRAWGRDQGLNQQGMMMPTVRDWCQPLVSMGCYGVLLSAPVQKSP